ncbi:adenylate/guanylate cyclase domain-containing protein [Sedimentitalea sp. HM32M-2]|uniref:adenylate/guanylate cyclase domain-containing protein n=1 Tax=Sedimentitalea sp. HM32M-2 TaxID=3351566 RepID=UPI00362BD200
MTRFDEQGWNARPVIDWLLDQGRFLDGLDDMVPALGDRLLQAGAPVWRLRLASRTLHPLITAVTSAWERDVKAIEPVRTLHGIEQSPAYIGSPMQFINRTRAPYRKRLLDPLGQADHEILHELKARGATDYYGLPMPFSDGNRAILLIATDDPQGFSDLDLGNFRMVAGVLGPIAEVFSARRVALAVAEAYLGRRTARRVLGGQITRGDIETIPAAILFSDIRGWTGLNAAKPADQVLALANRYFECLAGPVEDHGGEILKFIGDGVLAIFETGTDDETGHQACGQALRAAQAALVNELPLEFGIGLHFGDVLYGNIGSQTRIDFTVLGQAVNIAARIEGACRDLRKPLLYSQAVADRLDGPSALAATPVLRGVSGPTPVFAPG